MHVLIARTGEYAYAAWLREHPTVAWSPLATANANRLEHLVDEALTLTFQSTPPADFTFSTQLFEEVAAGLIESPEQLATSAIRCDIDLFCREGRLDDHTDRWASVNRGAGSTRVGSGLDFVFQPRTLRDRILSWFNWETFGPPSPHRQGPPPWDRQLLVRHGDGWQARQICPGSFPVFKPGPVVTPEMAASRLSRMPQNKSAARRAQQQANAERFRAEAAERARLRGEVA